MITLLLLFLFTLQNVTGERCLVYYSWPRWGWDDVGCGMGRGPGQTFSFENVVG